MPPRSARSSYAADVAVCLAFFSRFPIGRFGPPAEGVAPHRLAGAVRALPVAALVIALPAAVALGLLVVLGVSPLVAATVATLSLVAASGALHEDGLADLADGFWSGRDAAERLAIMRDSRVGAYGVLALVFSVLVRTALLAEAVAEAGAVAAMLILLAAAVAGRTAALFPWVRLPSAREDGLAHASGQPDERTFGAALVAGGAIALLLLVFSAPLAILLAPPFVAAAAFWVAALANHRVGGHTGDVIGAAEQAGEIAFLLAAIICLP